MGFFLFWAQKKCTKNAPGSHSHLVEVRPFILGVNEKAVAYGGYSEINYLCTHEKVLYAVNKSLLTGNDNLVSIFAT